MNDRIRQIRKELGLTLERFGERIGVKKSTLSQIENGKSRVTEHMQKSICREFNVDYIWLTTGKGEMFIYSDDDIVGLIDQIMVGDNEFHKSALRYLANMDEEDLDSLEHVMASAAQFYHSLKKE